MFTVALFPPTTASKPVPLPLVTLPPRGDPYSSCYTTTPLRTGSRRRDSRGGGRRAGPAAVLPAGQRLRPDAHPDLRKGPDPGADRPPPPDDGIARDRSSGAAARRCWSISRRAGVAGGRDGPWLPRSAEGVRAGVETLRR